jgi:hypothetical protein
MSTMPINTIQHNIICLATHNYRLRCFFAKLMALNKNFVNKGFRNCAIIKCFNMIYKDGSYGVGFEMISEGELIEGKPEDHWTIDEFNDLEISCNGAITTTICHNAQLFIDNTVYLIRHGEGNHNIISFFDNVKDKWDPRGISQYTDTSYQGS